MSDRGSKPRGKPRGMRRDRDCRSCKLRGVKCDLNRPRCLPCVQSGLPCGGYPQKVVWAAEVSARRASVSKPSPRGLSKKNNDDTTTTESSLPIIPIVAESSSSSRTILKATTSQPQQDEMLLSSDQSNSRLSLIKRLEEFCNRIKAMEGQPNDAGRYLSDEAIRLVSRIWDFMHARIPGSHHRVSTTDANAEAPPSVDSVQHYLEVLTVLNETLETANPVALLGIATFAFFEVCDGAFGEWQRHLYGARSLLDHHCQSRADLDQLTQGITGLVEIVQHLVWFDTMSAIIRGSTGLIFDDWHRQTLDQSYFSGVGCPADTFDLYVDLGKVEVDTDPLSFSIRAMDQLLKLDSDRADRAQSANAYRCTAAIAVLTRMSDANDARTTIPRRTALASAVDRACQAIASIPPTSKFHPHLAVTAYLSGINATSIGQCEIVRAYWQSCLSADFTHYLDAQVRCEERWREVGLA
ncbi:hypothetical protein F5884DRAFT_346961 [Xylogone sp. PMI_703]|nr:hypothetical protein F5884DRAFT_346961 [Xylogone sp. PMI_703]